MGYAGRHTIYEASIRRMVTRALEEQELEFRREHGQDPDEMLLAVVQEWTAGHGHTPWPEELRGGSFLAERFGSWENLMGLAGLPMPTHSRNPQSFERIREETARQKECYRRKKTEKKQLARKRLAEQAAKRKARENR